MYAPELDASHTIMHRAVGYMQRARARALETNTMTLCAPLRGTFSPHICGLRCARVDMSVRVFDRLIARIDTRVIACQPSFRAHNLRSKRRPSNCAHAALQMPPLPLPPLLLTSFDVTQCARRCAHLSKCCRKIMRRSHSHTAGKPRPRLRACCPHLFARPPTPAFAWPSYLTRVGRARARYVHSHALKREHARLQATRIVAVTHMLLHNNTSLAAVTSVRGYCKSATIWPHILPTRIHLSQRAVRRRKQLPMAA